MGYSNTYLSDLISSIPDYSRILAWEGLHASRSNVCFRDLLSQRSVHHHDSSEGFAYLWLEGNEGK